MFMILVVYCDCVPPAVPLSILLSMLEPIRRYGGQDLTVCRRGLRMTGDLAMVVARSGRTHRIPAVMTQLQEWMRVANEEGNFTVPELQSLKELYAHISETVAESGATLLGERNISRL